MLYIKEHIPSRMLSEFTFEKEMEAFNIEINLRKVKQVLIKYLIAGDAQLSDKKLGIFCSIWNSKSLGKEPTWFKNPNNPLCIDLFLTNTIRSFQETQVFETRLSDFHKLVVTVLKPTFPK